MLYGTPFAGLVACRDCLAHHHVVCASKTCLDEADQFRMVVSLAAYREGRRSDQGSPKKLLAPYLYRFHTCKGSRSRSDLRFVRVTGFLPGYSQTVQPAFLTPKQQLQACTSTRTFVYALCISTMLLQAWLQYLAMTIIALLDESLPLTFTPVRSGARALPAWTSTLKMED